MSVYPKKSVVCVAESIGISNISDEVSSALAPDVEYRLREIIQESLKFMRHGKRNKLTTEDINNALRSRNVEPLYGYKESSSLRFKKVEITKEELFYLDEPEIELTEIINAPLPRCPAEISYTSHWLAIEGVQPAIPENPSVVILADSSSNKTITQPPQLSSTASQTTRVASTFAVGAGMLQDVRPMIRHVVSKELQVYFDTIAAAIFGSDERARGAALENISSDPGLQQLVPYFCQFAVQQISKNSKNLFILTCVVKLLQSLLDNSHLYLEPYLHQILSALLTCVLKKSLSKSLSEDHWSLRDLSAHLVAGICQKFGRSYPTLQTRVTRTLLRGLLEPKKPLATNYGAISCLAALGQNVVHLLLLPHARALSALLEPHLSLGYKNKIRLEEAIRVKDLLLKTLGQFLRWYSQQQEFTTLGDDKPDLLVKASLKETYDEMFGIFGEALLPYIDCKNVKLLDQLACIKASGLNRPAGESTTIPIDQNYKSGVDNAIVDRKLSNEEAPELELESEEIPVALPSKRRVPFADSPKTNDHTFVSSEKKCFDVNDLSDSSKSPIEENGEKLELPS